MDEDAERKRSERIDARRARVLGEGAERQAEVAAHEALAQSAEGVDSVYFIESGPYVKIGRSTRVRARFAELKCGNPHPMHLLAVVPGGYALEAALRSRFARLHHRGEWFLLQDELKDHVKNIIRERKKRP